MKEFTFRLKADVSYLEAQFKGGAKELANLAAQAGKAEKKLEVLQEASVYLSQMDVMLSKVQKKYPNLFQEIFGNVNKQINDAIAPLGKMSDEMIKTFSKTRVKLDDLIKNPTAATVSEIEEIGKVFKLLSRTMGNTSLDFGFLDGASKNETKIRKLVEIMKELEQSYFNVGNAANMVDAGVKTKKKQSPRKKAQGGDGGDGAGFGTGAGSGSPDKVIKDNKTKTISYDELTKSVERYIEIQQKIEEIGDKQNRTAEDRQMMTDLEKESDAIISKLDTIKEGASDLLEDLQFGDIDKSEAIQKLSDLLGVSQTHGIDSAIDKVNILSQKINEVFQNAKKQKIELSVVITPDDVNVRPGDELSTKTSEDIGNMLASVGSEYFIDSHTHRDRTSRYNAVDFQNLVDLKKYGVTSTGSIFGNDGVNTIDLSGVSDKDAKKLADVLKSLNKVSFSAKEINDELAKINPKYGEIAKSWAPESFNDLANYFIQIANNADKSITPVERFKNIIQWFAGGKFDFSKYTKELADFKPENAGDIFNRMVSSVIGGEEVKIDSSQKSLADVLGDIAASSSPIQDTTKHIQGQIETYEELCSVVDRYNQLTLKDRLGETSKDEKSELDDIFDRIADINPDADLADLFDEEVLDAQQLANVIGIEIPQATETAEVAIENLGKEIDEALSQETGNTDKIENELEETNQKLREQEDLYQQVRTAIKGTLEEVVGMDYTAVALEDIEREIKDGLITTLEEAIARFKEMNNLTDDVTLRSVGENQRVADSWDYYQGNKYVDEDNEQVVRKSEYDLLNQKKSEIEDLKTTAEEARIKFLQLTQSLDADLFAGHYDEFSLGQSKAELDRAQQELQELAKDGYIAAEAMEEVNAAYQKTSSTISSSYEGMRTENMFREDAGSYELGYHDAEKRYEQNHIDDIRANNELQQKVEALEKELYEARQKASSGGQIGDSFKEESGAVSQSIQSEINELKRLEDKVFDVKHAVEQKIKAFVNEKRAVDSNVGAEIDQLENLRKKLEDIATQVQAISTINIAGEQEAGKPEPLDGAPLQGEQLGMDLDVAVQDVNELEAAEEKVEDAVEQTNDALDEQILKGKELAKQNGTLNHLQNEAKSAEKVLGESWSDKEKENYEQLIATISEYKNDKKKLTDEEISDIRKIVEAYQLQVKTIKQANEEEEKKSKAYGLKELNKATGSKNNIQALTMGVDSRFITSELEKVRQSYARLSEYQQRFNDGHDPTDEEVIAYRQLTNEYNDAAKALEKLFNASKKMNDNSRWVQNIDQGADISSKDGLKSALESAIKIHDGSAKIKEFRYELGELDYTVRNKDGTWSHFTASVDKATGAIVGLGDRVKTTNGFIRDLASGALNQFKSAMKRFSGFDLFYKGVAEVKKGIQYVRDIDKALTELRKVTNETEETYSEFLQTMSKTASVVGSTVSELTSSAADWARLKYLGLLYGNI